MVHQPHQHRRHEPAVLAPGMQGVIGRPGQQQLTPDAGHLVRLTHPPEQMHVRRRLPRPKPGTRPRTRRAPLLTMDAVVRPQLLLQMEREILALLMLITDHIMRTRHHTPSTPRTQPRRDDLGVQLLPLRRPPCRSLGRTTEGHRLHPVTDASDRAPARERPATACVAGERNEGGRSRVTIDRDPGTAPTPPRRRVAGAVASGSRGGTSPGGRCVHRRQRPVSGRLEARERRVTARPTRRREPRFGPRRGARDRGRTRRRSCRRPPCPKVGRRTTPTPSPP